MKPLPALTSADALRHYVPGVLTHAGDGPAWRDVLVEIHARPSLEPGLLVPAVAEPQIIWIISGSMLCEERELGGEWLSHPASRGDIFLTASPTPYELRWRSLSAEPIVDMQVLVGIPLLTRVMRELTGTDGPLPVLKEVHAVRDATLGVLLEQLRVELTERQVASELFVQGVAQSLAVHLVRNYRVDAESEAQQHPAVNSLPAARFRRVENMMRDALEEGIPVGELARAAEMSEAHFSRMFKNTTGFSPSQYFIRLRMAKAKKLLRETTRSIIEVGLEAGYTSASHFAQVFRKETGMTPHDYRQTEPEMRRS